MKRLISLFALVMTGCAVLSPGDAQSIAYYVLRDLNTERAVHTPGASASGPASQTVLMIGGVTAAALHDSDRMVYTRDGAGHGYYQFAHWSERPGKRLAVLTEQRLAHSGRFAAVVQSISGVKGDWLLNLRLDELTHDVRQTPGVIRLRLSAEIVDWRQRTLLARQTFEQIVPVATHDAPGAAQAANDAVTRQLDDLQRWTTGLLGSTSRTPKAGY
jgi:cholesterol transport system auxiliary component